ncbi:MAG: hypothetical protein HUK21_13060 [Fibrobacteraceae bacterium]|nr:hypothetical protein [Fibrobacteraceae bacterium]
MRRLGTIDQALANAKLSENDLKDLDGLSSTTIYRASNILDGDTMIITFQEGTMDIGKFVHFFINKAEPNSDDGKFYVTKYIAGGEVYVNLGTEEEILQEQQEAFKNSDEYFDYTVTTTIDENEVTFYFTYDTRCQEEETEENCEHYILKIAQNQDND